MSTGRHFRSRHSCPRHTLCLCRREAAIDCRPYPAHQLPCNQHALSLALCVRLSLSLCPCLSLCLGSPLAPSTRVPSRGAATRCQWPGGVAASVPGLLPHLLTVVTAHWRTGALARRRTQKCTHRPGRAAGMSSPSYEFEYRVQPGARPPHAARSSRVRARMPSTTRRRRGRGALRESFRSARSVRLRSARLADG